jgi:hypothetical protein
MATTRRTPIIRQTYYFGSKKIQVGDLKGGTKVGFISVHAKAAALIGLTLKLPKNIPSTTYTIENGIIFDSHSTARGKKVKTPVKAKPGSKKISVIYTGKPDAKALKSLGAKGLRAKAKKAPSSTGWVELGVPAWADVSTIRRFLRGTKAIGFSIDGNQHLISSATAGASNGSN